MWGLDRFSGHSTPAGSPPPQNRSFSPAPRRPSHLGPGLAARPPHSPRSSYLNVSSKYNSSTTSLNSPRLPNGSGLKQQITPPADFTDPLRSLEQLVGRSISDGDETHEEDAHAQLEKPAELVEDVDFRGRSIHDFLEDEDEPHGIRSLDSSRDTPQSVMECEYVYSSNTANLLILSVCVSDERDKDKFEDLHTSIIVHYILSNILFPSC